MALPGLVSPSVKAGVSTPGGSTHPVGLVAPSLKTGTSAPVIGGLEFLQAENGVTIQAENGAAFELGIERGGAGRSGPGEKSGGA